MMDLPVLYSFRRCPYAIRARMAIAYSGVSVVLREVVLRDIPQAMRDASPKATVPVLVLQDGVVIDESADIMRWALAQCDPDSWIASANIASCLSLIDESDNDFKTHLDHYKYADRFPDFSAQHYRTEAEFFLQKLEAKLQSGPFLFGENPGIADVAIFPFIRQLSLVDKPWFDAAPYPHLQSWLNHLLNSDLFLSVMQKYPAWQKGDAVTLFPSENLPQRQVS